MRLTDLTHEAVHHVVTRAHDLEDVYTLHGHRDPFIVTYGAMTYRNFAWVAWDDEPIAVFGGAPIHAGCWQMFLLATPEFGKVALPLTRFAKREVVPRLWALGAHRLQCDLHEKRALVHRWVEGFGARREGTMWGYAPDGSNYFRYTLVRP